MELADFIHFKGEHSKCPYHAYAIGIASRGPAKKHCSFHFFRALRRFRDSFKHVVEAFESACVVYVATPTLQHLISSPMLHSVWVHLSLWYSYALSEFWYIRFASN